MVKLRPLFVYFHSFLTTILQNNVGFSIIRTRIVKVEGKHADHWTTTTTTTTFWGNFFWPVWSFSTRAVRSHCHRLSLKYKEDEERFFTFDVAFFTQNLSNEDWNNGRTINRRTSSGIIIRNVGQKMLGKLTIRTWVAKMGIIDALKIIFSSDLKCAHLRWDLNCSVHFFKILVNYYW